ncbi:MAG TPA: stalk domain-containing protein [Ureibacillus sp.]|nr:stalk domain-containing protein [Ureibacillus sp.]
MKKYATLFIASALVCSFLYQPTGEASAFEIENGAIEEAKIQAPNFFEVTGEIQSITEQTKGNYFATVKEGEEEFGFYFQENTLILNNVGKKVELTEGVVITAFIDAKNSMIMIYPPRYTPEVVIVQTENSGSVELQRFDKQLLNGKRDIKIHVSDETFIHDLLGKPLTNADIIEKDVLIFYDLKLESYPAQITPFKIVVLEKEPSNREKAITIANQDYYDVNGVKMIPLRLVAEQLGFKVESTGRGAIVSKGKVSFTITRGTKRYTYNKALRYFQMEPSLLEKSKTYVPYEFLEELIDLEVTE